jgi:riboflavin kinase/FMN adenylyltransferase
MKVLRGLERRAVFPGGSVVAIGNFDGLHLGHQRILRALVKRAHGLGLPAVVLTFSPHPEKVLEGSRVGMIQTLDQRLAGIRASGADAVVIAAFDRAFAGLTAAEFAERVIASSLRAKAVVVGENFRFGRSREGDVDVLRQLGGGLGFIVDAVPSTVRNGRVVSSSLIRRLLGEGRIEAANALLGRPYEITGHVVRGSGRGRELGFPTANIRPLNEILPSGVFVTAAEMQGRSFPSVVNIGRRPTFGAGRLQVEVHLLAFSGRLYRRRLTLRFLRKIRVEKRFAGPEGLVRQVQADIAMARSFLRRKGMGFSAPRRETGD